MPDISMCQNKECKFKEDCYRFTAKPSEFMQAYGDFKGVEFDRNRYILLEEKYTKYSKQRR